MVYNHNIIWGTFENLIKKISAVFNLERGLRMLLENIAPDLRTEEGKLTHILPEDIMFFDRSKSADKEVWTFGFCRGGNSLYFLDGDKKRFLTSNVVDHKLDTVNYKKRKFIVEMLCGMLGYDYKETPSSYHTRKYVFTAKKKMS